MKEVMEWPTAGELAQAMGLHRSNIVRRAAKEGWAYRDETCRGGKRRLYDLAELPAQVRRALKLTRQQPGQPVVTHLPALVDSVAPALPAAQPPVPLNSAMQAKALAKADILRLYSQKIAAAPWGQQTAARDDFIAAYNSGAAWPALYATIGPIASWKTIEGWKGKAKRYRGDSLAALADRRGYVGKGSCALTSAQTDILLACVLHPNKPRISEAIRMAHAVMAAKGVSNGSSEATYRRWLGRWIERNHHIWVFNREGAKAWNDQCAYYIERDYSLIQVGDIVVADGHTLNFEVLNPWTGKAKRMTLIVWKDMKSNAPLGWEIMPTEDTAAISSALRRAILRLGKIPKVAYLDNGRAFRARFFEGCNFDEAGFAGLYERLGMQTIHAWPYHGQSKTVERFFGTFAELERWAPSYTGTSIEHKPPRLNRGERLHRRLHEQVTGGQPITLEQAHRAIAVWFDAYMARPQAGHLDGQTPLEVFEAGRGPGVDPAELTYLMMSLAVKTIHRNGISFLGQNYYHPALYGRRHKVTVRYDLQDPAAIYVFGPDGEYLCAATPVEKVHPAAAQLGNEDDQRRLVAHIEHKKRQEKEASRTAREMLERHVLPEHQRQLSQIGILPEPSAGPAPGRPEKVVRLDYEKAVRESKAQIAAQKEEDARREREELARMSEADRYEKLMEMVAQGRELADDQIGFMAYYEGTAEYAEYREFWDQRRLAHAIMYRQEQDAQAE